MRLCLLVLSLVCAAGAGAQPTSRADSSQFYVSPVLGLAYSSSSGGAFLVGAIAGRQLGPRADAGVGVFGGDLTYSDFTPFLMVQPQVGVRVPLGDALRGRAQLAVSALAADLDTAADPEGFGLRVLGSQAEATASYEIPLVGTLRLAPTAGGYGAVCTTVDVAERPGDSCAEAGVLAGAEVLFEVFGVDAVVPLVVPIRVVGNTDAADLNGVFNLARRAVPGGVRLRF